MDRRASESGVLHNSLTDCIYGVSAIRTETIWQSNDIHFKSVIADVIESESNRENLPPKSERHAGKESYGLFP